jgi:hypothetical protein
MNPSNIPSTKFKSDTPTVTNNNINNNNIPDTGYDKPQDPSKTANSKKTVTFSENFDNAKPVKHIPFWTENPNVLFQQEYIFEFFPVEDMIYNQKLNAVSRTIILLTIIGFAFSHSIRTILIGAVTLGAIFVMYFYHKKESDKIESKKLDKSDKSSDKSFEGFESNDNNNSVNTTNGLGNDYGNSNSTDGNSPGKDFMLQNKIPIPIGVFDEPNSSNPFSNVLVTDYDYNPNKKPAPPSYNQNVNADILSKAKQFVNNANPDQPNIADKLFRDLGEQLEFEQSLRPFNSNPSTTIPNDQGAFADFCYGSMISCKEGNKFACARNTSHYSIY